MGEEEYNHTPSSNEEEVTATAVAAAVVFNPSIENSDQQTTSIPESHDEQQQQQQQQHQQNDGGPDHSEFTLLVILQPDNVRHRVIGSPSMSILKLKETICHDLKLSLDLISFPQLDPGSNGPIDDLTLGHFGYHHHHLHQNSQDPQIIHAYVARRMTTSGYIMPDKIQVQVYKEEDHTYHTISVEIEKFQGKKAYLGGFRHRKSEQIFHHATTQTYETRARRHFLIPRSHRDTQTQVLVTKTQQTIRESGTQMARQDLRLDDTKDRLVFPRTYVDSHQRVCICKNSVLLIQKMWQGYRARLYVYNLREEKKRQASLVEMEARQDAAHDLTKQRKEIERRMHPKSVSDFEVLYNELDKWRQQETKKLQDQQKQLSIEAKQKALEEILAKETKLLQTIDRLKLTANDSNRKQRIESMLQYMARPKQWQMSDGEVKEVHTPFTIRAKELTDLYHGLKMHLTSVDERLEVLLHVKWTVKEFDSQLTRDIIELIDREADMLNRGRKDKSLEGLRKRLTNLFLQFIETPEYNPEAATLKAGSNNTF